MSNYKIGVEFEADGSKAVNAISQVSQAMQGLQNQMATSSAKTSSSISKIGISLGSIVKGAIAISGLSSIKSGILGIVDATSKMQSITASFEVFTGSVDVAKSTLLELKNIALQSPMQFQDVVEGGKVLMNYGMTAQSIIPMVRMLGDISGGNTDRFNRLALAFGQVNGAGRLMGQELRQMINAGFNPLQTLSEKTGESMASLTKRMHDGKVSVQEVAQAFIYATSEGGRFFGNADRQSQTLGGQLNKLQERIFFIATDFGDFITKTIDVNKAFDSLANLVTNFGDAIKEVVVNFSKFENLKSLLSGAFKVIIGLGYNLIVVFDKIAWLVDKILGGISSALDFLKKYDSSNIIRQLTGLIAMPFTETAKKGEAVLSTSKNNKIVKDDKDKRIAELQTLLNDLKSKQNKNLSETTSKTEQNRINKLKEQAKEGYTKLTEMYRAYTMSKADIMKQEAVQELVLYKKYGIDTRNVVKSQYQELQRVSSEETRKLSALVNKNLTISNLKESISKMIEDQANKLKEVKDALDASILKFRENNPYKRITTAGQISMGFTDEQSATQKDAMERFGATMYQAQVGLATTLGNGFSEIAGGIMSGQLSISDAFASAGSVFLGAFGDFLVTVGQEAIKAGVIKLGIEEAFKNIFSGGAALIGFGMAAVSIGTAMKSASQKTAEALNNTKNISSTSIPSTSSKSMASGSTYSSGSMAYPTQSLRLSIDLTGAITASPTGYNINKSLETVLRVTGR